MNTSSRLARWMDFAFALLTPIPVPLALVGLLGAAAWHCIFAPALAAEAAAAAEAARAHADWLRVERAVLAREVEPLPRRLRVPLGGPAAWRPGPWPGAGSGSGAEAVAGLEAGHAIGPVE